LGEPGGEKAHKLLHVDPVYGETPTPKPKKEKKPPEASEE
jgi:hypothetical protein